MTERVQQRVPPSGPRAGRRLRSNYLHLLRPMPTADRARRLAELLEEVADAGAELRKILERRRTTGSAVGRQR